MPLIRRLPKRGFNNAAFHKRYAIVNVSELNAFEAGAFVNEQRLRESNLVRGDFTGIKILGEGELKHGLQVETDKISTTAREKIEKAGGTVTIRETLKIEKSEADVVPPEANARAADTRAKPRAKAKSKSPKKKRE
jgi:large subunit ribosomal protein L15